MAYHEKEAAALARTSGIGGRGAYIGVHPPGDRKSGQARLGAQRAVGTTVMATERMRGKRC
jgi:hypothetical protein